MICNKILVVMLLLALGSLGCEGKSAYHKEIEEGDCKSEYTKWKNINYLGIARQTPHEGWMIPMSSKHLAYHLGRQLTGNDSLPETDLQQLCLRLTHKGIISYHNANTTLFYCNKTMFQAVNCYSTAVEPHHHAAGPITMTLVWIDESSHHILMVLCASEPNQKYWLLASNEAVVDPNTKSKVLGIVSDLGFDSNKVLYHDHSQCTEAGKRKRSPFHFG
ncbi:unnamed protein product [Orchesella dallaii]|uniref:Uncharacterized protein n=1 Tax=Orchesella dallaii TaxID=48710 RepID=A0ABP1S077_9HEXA